MRRSRQREAVTWPGTQLAGGTFQIQTQPGSRVLILIPHAVLLRDHTDSPSQEQGLQMHLIALDFMELAGSLRAGAGLWQTSTLQTRSGLSEAQLVADVLPTQWGLLRNSRQTGVVVETRFSVVAVSSCPRPGPRRLGNTLKVWMKLIRPSGRPTCAVPLTRAGTSASSTMGPGTCHLSPTRSTRSAPMALLPQVSGLALCGPPGRLCNVPAPSHELLGAGRPRAPLVGSGPGHDAGAPARS